MKCIKTLKLRSLDIFNLVKWVLFWWKITPIVKGPTQVKCRLLISSIFDAMNFQHFLEMLEFNLWYFLKMSKIHYIKMLEIKSQHLT